MTLYERKIQRYVEGCFSALRIEKSVTRPSRCLFRSIKLLQVTSLDFRENIGRVT